MPSSVATVTTTPHSSPPLPLLNYIDLDNIPTFLLSHGKGKQEVNIFQYLNKVKDPHFHQVLLYYLRFEANDKSGMGSTLSTAQRLAEISQWTLRVCPANLPDYTKGKQTFANFVDSIFSWWRSLQPSWRLFKCDEVSREVQGGLGVLHTPHINRLLNIVMLMYRWSQILKEHKLEDGVHADFEWFSEDVAWVFSNLST